MHQLAGKCKLQHVSRKNKSRSLPEETIGEQGAREATREEAGPKQGGDDNTSGEHDPTEEQKHVASPTDAAGEATTAASTSKAAPAVLGLGPPTPKKGELDARHGERRRA